MAKIKRVREFEGTYESPDSPDYSHNMIKYSTNKKDTSGNGIEYKFATDHVSKKDGHKYTQYGSLMRGHFGDAKYGISFTNYRHNPDGSLKIANTNLMYGNSLEELKKEYSKHTRKFKDRLGDEFFSRVDEAIKHSENLSKNIKVRARTGRSGG